MKHAPRILAVCAVSLLAGVLFAVAGETNQAASLTLDLTDGSRITGTPSIESIPLRTDYAKLDIPLRNIRSIAVDANHETASLTMVNSDKLRGAVTLGPLQLNTIIGAVSVDFALITRMTVLAGNGRSLPAALTDALVLYYSFDEDGNGAVKDGTGKTTPGQVHDAKWTDKGKMGGAYDFDGQRSHITVPAVDTVGEATWSVWVRPRSFPSRHDTYAQILGVRSRLWAWNSDNTAVAFTCQEHYAPSRLALFFAIQETPSTSGSALFNFQTRPEVDRWYHVAIVMDSSGIHLYLDGKVIAESADKIKIPAPSPMIIGKNDNGPQRFFDGLIDEVMVFKKALTAEDIELIRTAQR